MNSILKEYIPQSWFHPKGIHKVVHKLEPRLPDVSGNLFLTFTVDPSLFQSPESAFDITRDRLRRIFHRLRKGFEWEGKTIRIQAPYLTKVEFHQNGWAHFHVIFRTRRFLDGNALRHLWGYGRTHVARIQQKEFRYLLKYVTKGGEFPDWVLNRKRIRIIQTSRGFYKPDPAEEETKAARSADPAKAKKRECSTIRERLEKWSRMAILIHPDNTCLPIHLYEPFWDIFNRIILSVARSGRYPGNGKIKIKQRKELYPWIINPQINNPVSCSLEPLSPVPPPF